jgi:hypothetical protein
VLIVLDSNVFYGDVHARRARLSAVLTGARNGDFAVMVPRVVLDELSRQFPERVGAVRKKATTALTNLAVEFSSLGLEQPQVPDLDEESLTAEYGGALEKRLTASGVEIAPHPDLAAVISWAIARRKPFKQDGRGLPDAAIWLNVLKAAASVDDVVLVTGNTSDFGDGVVPPNLAPELVADLVAQGSPAGRVRLVTSLEQLVAEIVEPLALADVRARRLLDDQTTWLRLKEALTARMLSAPFPQEGLDLPVPLDEDPQLDWVTIESASLQSARALDKGRLLLELQILVSMTMRMYVFKEDYYVAGEPPELEVTDPDWNDHYLEATIDLAAFADVSVATDAKAQLVEIDVNGAEPAYGDALADARLSREEEVIAAEVPELVRGHSVRGYIPPEGAEADIEEAVLELFAPASVELDSVIEESGTTVEVIALVRGTGAVRWRMTAPAPFDIETYSASAEADSRGPGWLGASASSEPILVSVKGFLTTAGLDGLELLSVSLDEDEAERRVGARVAGEDQRALKIRVDDE